MPKKAGVKNCRMYTFKRQGVLIFLQSAALFYILNVAPATGEFIAAGIKTVPALY
jgi:hypothetical protein